MAKKEINRISSPILNNIDILILGDDADSKLDKTQEICIKIWEEEKFLEVIRNQKG